MRFFSTFLVILPTVLGLVAGKLQKSVLKSSTSFRHSTKLKTGEDADVVGFGFGRRPKAPLGGSATISSSVFNLAKCILGAGILSLPAGIASFSDSSQALIPSSAIILFLGALSAYSFSSIGRACRKHNVYSFAEAWKKSVNEKSGPFITFVITFKTFFACLAYSIIIGDSFSQIFNTFGFGPVISNRSNVILGLTSLFIFPLCLLKQLDALKYTSLLGLLGIFYCVGFMGLRLFDGSYAPGGKFYSTIAAVMQPSFNKRVGPLLNPDIFKMVSMVSTAYVAHYNAPKFLEELKNPTMPRYNTVVGSAFFISVVMYLIIAFIGFSTFGGHASGFVLNNYASKDKLATFARVAIGLGILCGYPLTFSALRDGFFELFKVSKENKEKLFIPTTLFLLSGLTVGALLMKNLGVVVSFSGALIGSGVIYIIPAIMNIFNIKNDGLNKKTKKVTLTFAQKLELIGNYLFAMMGTFLAIVGVYVNLKK